MSKVQLLGDKAEGYQLTVYGEPFFIKGAGLESALLKLLAEAGGNAFRTWRVANGERDTIDILDEAEALGSQVCMGLDVARERRGFDYSDQAAIIAQNEALMHDLTRLKDHPALLMWGLGNEATVDWTDHLIEPEAVTAYAALLRARIFQPVTFCENYVPWLDKLTGLAEELDVIAIHTYTVWEFKTVAEAMAYTSENFNAVQSAYPNKQVIITEAGWATASNGRGIPPENVGELFQETYLRELLEWAEEEEILVYIFEAFDENWKGSDHPLEPEKHWRIYRADRSGKPGLSFQT